MYSKGFYETDIYLYTAEGLRKIEVPSDVEYKGMHGDEMLLYLQSDWETENETYKSGTLVSYDLTVSFPAKQQ